MFVQATLDVRRFVSVDDAFGGEAIQIAFDVIKQCFRLILIFGLAQPLDQRTHAAAVHTVLLAPFGILANTLNGRFMLGHVLQR